MDNFSPTSKFPFLYIYACQAVAMQQYNMSVNLSPIGTTTEESKTKKEDETNMIGVEALAQLFSFLANAATSVVFLIITFTTNSTCHIRNTYRQDFLSKIQSDPLYSSTNVFRSGPLPQLSSVEGDKTLYSHLHSDIGIFPVMAYKDSGNSSYPYLGRALNSQQALYFFAKHSGGGKSTAVDMTMDSKAQMMMMQTGSGQVDYLRCLSISPGNSAADLKHKMDAMRKSSRRMGTCLLTGQHATVDISGNPRTSMVLFSSVNPMFMASVVLWISTSFSLFYFGKSAIKYLEVHRNLTVKWGSAVSRNWGISDTVLLICTLWNVVPAIVFLTPLAQHHNIPVNNSVLAFIAIMITVAVQWYFANLEKPDATDGSQRGTVSKFSTGGGKQYFFSTTNFFPAYPFGKKGYMAMGNAITTDSYMRNIQVHYVTDCFITQCPLFSLLNLFFELSRIWKKQMRLFSAAREQSLCHSSYLWHFHLSAAQCPLRWPISCLFCLFSSTYATG